MTRKFFALLLFNIIIITAGAQDVMNSRLQTTPDSIASPAAPDSITAPAAVDSVISGPDTVAKTVGAKFSEWCKTNNVLNNLDVALTVGTTGLGFELSTPVTKWASLRAGFEFMPKFTMPMHFDVSTYSGDNIAGGFTHIQDLMYELTGEHIDDRVTMNAKLNFMNFKLLVDVFPFRNNRHWHFTGGLFIGTSVIGTAVNSKDETNSLVAMNIYNRIYEKMKESNGEEPLFGDIYLSHEKYEQMMRYGRVGIHIGDFKDSTPYYMTPESNGTVSARALANRVKPYLGFGYSSSCDSAGRLNLGFEAGALFWGGSPAVMLADGVNMTTELKNVRGKVGDYLDAIKALSVYPAIAFKISYTFF